MHKSTQAKGRHIIFQINFAFQVQTTNAFNCMTFSECLLNISDKERGKKTTNQHQLSPPSIPSPNRIEFHSSTTIRRKNGYQRQMRNLDRRPAGLKNYNKRREIQ